LEAGQFYQVVVGPENQRAAEYDLEFFRKDLPKVLTELTPGVLLPMGVSPSNAGGISPTPSPAVPVSGMNGGKPMGAANPKSNPTSKSGGDAPASMQTNAGHQDTGSVPLASSASAGIPAQPASLTNAAGEDPPAKKNQPEWWIWAAIGAVVVVLGFFSIRMLKEQGKGAEETVEES
jgi:hypothetical protein